MEWNERRARICISCKMILKYESYTDALQNEENRDAEIEKLKENFNKEIQALREQLAIVMKKQISELLNRLKPEIVREALSL
jgi:hypothetical protein